MTPGEEISRAEQATRILSDPLVREALQTLKAATRDAFYETAAEAVQRREMLHLMDRARQQFENVFTILIANGEVAKNDLVNEADAQRRADLYRSRYATSQES